MELRILGPLEVRDGERVVSIPRRKHRSLLAILILRANNLVPTEVLLDELWGGEPPRTARQAVHNYVSLLRKELGAEALETHDEGYVLRVGEDVIDARRFERLVASAAGEDRRALLSEALELWRGPALADFAYEPFAVHEARRLDELRLNAHEDLVDADLALGRHEALVPELERLVIEHPYRERLRSQLMLALYRSGRQVDALEAYRAARRALIDLGLEPSEALRGLEQEILRQDPALGLDQSAEETRRTVSVLVCELALEPSGLDPEHVRARLARAMAEARAAVEAHGGAVELLAGDELLAVFDAAEAIGSVRAGAEIRAAGDFRIGIATGEALSGRGFVSGEVVAAAKRLERAATPGEVVLDDRTRERCGEVVAVDDAQRLVRLDPESRPTRLEPQFPFVGRGGELARLRAAYEIAPALVTVVGEPGIGKTRLARELALAVRDEATVLVGRCSSAAEGATFLPLREMLLQAGLALDAVIDETTTVGEQLLEVRRAFERLAIELPLVLVFDDVHLAEPALHDFVGQLGSRASGRVLTICLTRPEGTLAGEVLELGALSPTDVRELVGDRPELAAAAGGNPLFAEQLLAYLEQGGSPDAVPPSIESLIGARLDRLNATERAILRRAAVIGQTFTRAAVDELAPSPGDASISPTLVALVEKRYLRRLRVGFRFHHPLVREVTYASVPKEERAELHQRYADWLDERNEPDELVGYHLEQASRYRAELRPNDAAGRRLGAAAGRRLGEAGIRAWKRGDASAAANLLGRAAGLLPADEPRRIEVMCELAPALRMRGDLAAAVATLEQAMAGAAALRDRRLELRAALELSLVQLFNEPAQATVLETAETAIPVFESVDDARSLGRAWLATATVLGAFHNAYEVAASAAERALQHYIDAGWPTPACLALLSSALHHGPTPVDEAIARCRELSVGADLLGRANVTINLAGLEAMRGGFDDARALLALARSIYEELGHKQLVEIDWRGETIRIELLAGNLQAAEEELRASCSALEESGDRAYLATRAAQLANLLAETARTEEAETWCDLAGELGRPDDIPTQVLARTARAKVLSLRGAMAEAESVAREAVALTAHVDHLTQRATVLLALAEVVEDPEIVAEAIELFERKGNIVGAARARARLAGAPTG